MLPWKNLIENEDKKEVGMLQLRGKKLSLIAGIVARKIVRLFIGEKLGKAINFALMVLINKVCIAMAVLLYVYVLYVGNSYEVREFRFSRFIRF